MDLSEFDGVNDLGILSRNETLLYLRNSLCLLHVNDVYPEVFGFSNIEANLLGTPVLCYDIGALSETMSYSLNQIINCKDHLIVNTKILKFKESGIPLVKRSSEYSKQNVVNLWIVALGM